MTPHRRRLLLTVSMTCVIAAVLLYFAGAEFCLWRGKAALSARDSTAAIAWVERAERLGGESGESHFLLARAYRQLRQFDRVEQELRAAHRLHFDVVQLQREQWLALAQTAQFDAVRDHWDELFTDSREDGQIISEAYVLWCLSRFRLPEALAALAAWQKDFPADAQPHYLRALVQEALLNWDHAIREHRAALELDPRRSDVRFRLAECMMHRLQVREAEAEYRLCVTEDGSNRTATVGLAKSLLKLGRTDEARQTIVRQLDTTSPDVDALQVMGDIELTRGRPESALKYLEQACARQPESPETHYLLGRALQSLGRSEAARPHFDFVAESQPALDTLGVKMEELVRRPHDVELRFQVAQTTWKYKSRANGAKWFNSLLEYDPHHIPTHRALAEHYAILGDEKRAAEHRRLAGGGT